MTLLRVLCILVAIVGLSTASRDIFVNNPTTGEINVVSMNSDATVHDLKRALKGQSVIAELADWDESDLLFDLFSLSFGGTPMVDDATLADLGVGAEAVVEVQTGTTLFNF